LRPPALVVMAKAPMAGRVKTRLCPPLDPEVAAGLYRAFLLDVLETCRSVPGVDRYLFVDPPGSCDWFRAVAPGYAVEPQVGERLGPRLAAVFERLFGLGHPSVVVRNSDSPDLPPELLEQAFAGLDDRDVVLGPDEGGGYYLVGLKQAQPSLFVEVPMGHPGNREATLAEARRLGLRLHLLSAWLDVDRPEDLDRLWRRLLDSEFAARCPRSRRFLATLRQED